jgi:hypothetical protein
MKVVDWRKSSGEGTEVYPSGEESTGCDGADARVCTSSEIVEDNTKNATGGGSRGADVVGESSPRDVFSGVQGCINNQDDCSGEGELSLVFSEDTSNTEHVGMENERVGVENGPGDVMGEGTLRESVKEGPETHRSPHHSRRGSKNVYSHSRTPSDVCPRVAVIATQEEEENVCSICLDEFCDDDPIAETLCGHGYHLQCIMQWAQRSRECPLCFSELGLIDEDMNALLPFGEYSSPENERAMSNMLQNMEFESFLIHLAAAERRQERQQLRERRQIQRHHRERISGDGGHVVIPAGDARPGDSNSSESPSESTLLKSVKRGFASFFLGK